MERMLKHWPIALVLLCAITTWSAPAQPPRPGEQRRGGSNRAPRPAGREQGRGQGDRGGPQGGSADQRRPGDERRGGPGAGDSEQVIRRKIGLITNTAEAFNGYTLFAPKHFLITYLMTNDGQMVNSWTSQYEPGQSVYLLPNGHLLHCCLTKNRTFIGGGEGGRLEEYDWQGNLVWEYWCSDEQKLMHHDVEPMPNGNILAMVVEKKSYEECLAAGFTPDSLRDQWLFPEYIIEIEPTPPKGAKIVWEWRVWDHLIQNNDSTKPNYGDPAEHPERIDVDVSGRTATAFWNHMNSMDYNPELDQIMLSVRGCSELWIIDHGTTTKEAAGRTGGRYGKGGDLLYRWGNPQAYGRGDGRDQQLFQQHDCQWIEPGLPGAGNILIFNNGLNRAPGKRGAEASGERRGGGSNVGYSSIDEIMPPVDEKGNYALESGVPYGPKEIAWTYVAPNPTDFYAEAISGCQRLPNGNTLICDGTSGAFFELSPDKRKVWEYVSPVTREGPIKQGEPIGVDHRGHATNAVFKIHRYSADYPGLAGKDLSPKGLITGSTPPPVPENLSSRFVDAPGGTDRNASRQGAGGRRAGGQGGGKR